MGDLSLHQHISDPLPPGSLQDVKTEERSLSSEEDNQVLPPSTQTSSLRCHRQPWEYTARHMVGPHKQLQGVSNSTSPPMAQCSLNSTPSYSPAKSKLRLSKEGLIATEVSLSHTLLLGTESCRAPLQNSLH